MSTEVNIAIVCITENGKNLALKIQTLIKDSHVYIVSNKQNKLQLENESKNIFLVKEKLSVLTEKLFKDYQYILFIMATGIVVRVIAPYIVSKFSDPAIMVTDEKGQNVISLLSGHMGGANEMTKRISKLINANPVITTATDVNKKSALDMIAKELDAHIDDFRDNVKDVNAMLVNNQDVGIYIDGKYDVDTRGFKVLSNLENTDSIAKIVVITNKNDFFRDYIDKYKDSCINQKQLEEKIIKVIPKDIVIGIGCKKNTDSDHMKNSLLKFLDEYNIDINGIKEIGSIEIKKEEKAIIDLAKFLDVDFKTFSVDEISKVDYLYEKSQWVKKNVGVYSVSDPVAHLLSEGRVIINKQKYDGITFSIGRIDI